MFENLEKAQKHSSVFRECSDYFRCSKILNEYIRELTTELDFASNLFLVFENDFSYGKLTKFFDIIETAIQNKYNPNSSNSSNQGKYFPGNTLVNPRNNINLTKKILLLV